MGLAVPLGLAIALNRHVAEIFRPVLSFLQAIAGIAWVPLTIIWFGIGNGSVVFVIANTIFFASLYNTVIGVQSIPTPLYRAVRSHGGHGIALLTNLILPGAMVQLLLGVRTSMAYGWRALVASEMIAGSSGLGYMTMEAVQWQRTDIIILGMIVIGLIWVVMDRVVFTAIERRTVARWGLLQR
jgi:NitT/TauT family transport system permease protein/taurine transport system permease protein